MFSIRSNVALVVSLAAMLLLSHGVVAKEQLVDSAAFVKFDSQAKTAPVKLLVWPRRIVSRCGEPVTIHVASVNVSRSDVYIRDFVGPVPSVPNMSGNLVTHIFSRRTGKQVHYKQPPLALSVEERQGQEHTNVFKPHKIFGVALNLRERYALPSGDYRLVMYFDSRYVPNYMHLDKRSWHGQTNVVTARIQVLK